MISTYSFIERSCRPRRGRRLDHLHRVFWKARGAQSFVHHAAIAMLERTDFQPPA